MKRWKTLCGLIAAGLMTLLGPSVRSGADVVPPDNSLSDRTDRLVSRMDMAREKLVRPGVTLPERSEGSFKGKQYAQWYNWPNWRNWGNWGNWRNW